MKKPLSIIVTLALCTGMCSALSAAPKNTPVFKSQITIRHRGTNPDVVGGTAKSAGNINGANVHLKR